MASTHKTKTRDLILDTALELFNTRGSHKVTTNHIAKAMGISPGNLYYHYESKEHIVRELLKRLIAGFDSLVRREMERTSLLDLIDETIAAMCGLIHSYRFIYVELAALLARDPLFKEMYQDIKFRRIRDFRSFFDSLAQMGVLGPNVTPGEQEAMVFILWTYAEGIITALHTSNIPVTPEAIQTHFKKILLIFKAFLAPDDWTALARKLDLPSPV